MIVLNIDKAEDGFALKATGHARYAPAGEEDIVCASFSMLMYTLCESLSHCKETLLSGNAEIICEHATREDWNALAVILKGLRLLADSEPNCLQINNNLSKKM